MRTRRFGRTEAQLSEFMFGGGWVGGLLIHESDEVAFEALRRAVAAGCNCIDTAADYGQGKSEETLGRLLPALDSQPMLSSKVRIATGNGESHASQIRRSLERSLARLRKDRLSFFKLHNRIGTSTGNGILSPADALRAMDTFDELRAEGLFEHSGFTAVGERRPILELIGSGRLDTAQVYYNVLNPSAGRNAVPAWGGQDFSGVLDACEEQDIGVMAIRVLAAGVLASTERHGREVVIASDAGVAREEIRSRHLFGILGDRHGTRAQTSIRYALAEQRISTVVVGLASLEQLDEALAAFDAGPLPPSVLAQIEVCHQGVI